MSYIHRQIEPMVQKLVRSFPSLAISGPRQSGESTLLINTLKGHQYITLDDSVTRERAAVGAGGERADLSSAPVL